MNEPSSDEVAKFIVEWRNKNIFQKAVYILTSCVIIAVGRLLPTMKETATKPPTTGEKS